MLLIHGWESARDRTLPNALILNAIGMHVLTLDVRGHGANPPEELPLTAGEFGEDALAGVETLLARPDVTAVGILGHSMGGIGALLAAAAEPRVAAVVAASTPADPYRLTRQTFRLAKLPFPGPFAWPLAWLTTHVFLQPRGHTVRSVSAARAIERYAGPVLLIHGDADRVVPFSHLATLEDAAQRAREQQPGAPDVEVLAIPGGEHSWLYEFAAYRGAVARFLTEAFDGPLEPDEAEAIARATPATRLPAARAPVLRDQAGRGRPEDAREGHPDGRAESNSGRSPAADRRRTRHDRRLGRDQDQAHGPHLRRTGRSRPSTSSGSSMPVATPAARRTSSAGTSSSSRSGRRCAG